MKRFFAVAAVLFCGVAFTASAYSQAAYVDERLKQAYEQVTGKNFDEEVKKLLPQQKSPVSQVGNVVVQFNGGGANNRVYIGQKNRLEILVSNDAPIRGMSIGFKFTCSVGAFNWVDGYGDKPDTGVHAGVVMRHGDALDAFDIGGTQVHTGKLPDSILIGGAALNKPLPAQTTERLLYSMLLDVPANLPETVNGFCVDNIFFPPAGAWKFDEGGVSYAPRFQGQTNTSPSNPDAPPVCFDIVKACWQPLSGPMPSPPAESTTSARTPRYDLTQIPGTIVQKDGRVVLALTLRFQGDIRELERLEPELTLDRIDGKVVLVGDIVIAYFPIELLPKVSTTPGVKEVRVQVRLEYELDYSAPMIEGYYATIDSTHHVSGTDVVVGIVDSGIEWLHRDFRDSSGNTRVLYLWDQTSSSGPAPPWFAYGKEWSSASIDQEIAAGRFGPDSHGHGTHVAGIAAGNGSSRSPRTYVGIAPKSHIIGVRTGFTPIQIRDGIRYVAYRASELNKPWVVNLSLAYPFSYPTSRDGNAWLETQIDDIVASADSAYGRGRVVVVATGNEGADSLHAYRKEPGEVQLNIETNASTFDRDDSINICILYRSQGVQTASVTVLAPPYDARSTYGPVNLGCMSGPTYAPYYGWQCDSSDAETDGLVRIFNNAFPPGGDPVENHPNDFVAMIQMRDDTCHQTSRLSRLRPGVWKIRMQGVGLGAWDAYIIGMDTLHLRKKFAAGSATAFHTISSPATCHNCIAVGSINSTRTSWNSAAYPYPRPITYIDPGFVTDSISPFSNLGWTRDGRVKPELFAPGAWIMSCKPYTVTDPHSKAYYSLYWDADSIHYLNAGTSMAAPHVTGTVALMLDKSPQLTWEEVRDSLIAYGFLVDILTPRIDLRVHATLKRLSGTAGEQDQNINSRFPMTFSLLQNYPNPFNPETRIKFVIPSNSENKGLSHVRLDVLNILGQKVRTLVDGEVTPGEHEITWFGDSDVGRSVASGVYFYRCVYDHKTQTRKMVLLK